jgi:hypothetical protein
LKEKAEVEIKLKDELLGVEKELLKEKYFNLTLVRSVTVLLLK